MEVSEPPFGEDPARIKERMDARAAGAAAPAPAATAATPAPRTPRADVGAEHATMDELDAQIAVLEAEKARRQRQVTRTPSVGSGSAAAAAMTAAGPELPQTQAGERAKRVAGPTSEVSRKSPRGTRD